MSQPALRSRVGCARLGSVLGCSWALVACGEAGSCPAISARTSEPVRVETSSELLSATPDARQLVVSDGGLYWHDGMAISALQPGQDRGSELYTLPQADPAATSPAASDVKRVITSLLADADQLYWSEGSVYTGPDAGFVVGYSPPGRVLSIPKAGGPVQLLLDLSDRVVTPVAVDDARVIVQLSGAAAGYYQLGKLDQSLSPLRTPALYETSRVVGDQIYWTEGYDGNPRLFRAKLDATKPQSIASIEGGDYDVGPGYVLWRHDRTVTEPELLLEQNFVIWREGSGCVQSLPGTGESISSATARDARHVYWHSFNALGSVSESSDGTTSPPPEVSLERLDLNSGRLERLEAGGFHSSLGDQILGVDSEHLFVATHAGLVTIRTP